jgi:hypothetical protein
MAHSQVPQVVLKENGDIELTVQIVGFTDGMPVEVYGYVSQDSGNFGSFRENRIVPKPEGTDPAKITVTITPDNLKLTENEPLTVVTWVSEVWPSMLTVDPSTAHTSTTGTITAAWSINQAASDSWLNNPGSPGWGTGGAGSSS